MPGAPADTALCETEQETDELSLGRGTVKIHKAKAGETGPAPSRARARAARAGQDGTRAPDRTWFGALRPAAGELSGPRGPSPPSTAPAARA
ncbi:MAG: hypothetical protein JWN08_2846 [Frankiales bacterium]|nr:hypothetical protein [Frankiales bacterium]